MTQSMIPKFKIKKRNVNLKKGDAVPMVNRKVLQQMIMHKTIAKLQTPLKNNKPGKYGLFL
jgi:hypothetical protein